ncbi:MAG: hypothetical protein JOY77_13640 [Alphaproteobacteria bacterium]|nr:hypothetical protein [Alphaproteobacteria bacterium]
MLVEDVRAGYLPHPQQDPRGWKKGIGRLWEPWAWRRAAYLYRLRQRGATGPLLHVLLFLRDGWGWQRVRPLCLAGCRKIVGGEVSRIRRRLRRITPQGIVTIVEEIEAEPVMQEAALFTWGLGLFGKPLPGGTLKPFLSAVAATFGVQFAPGDVDEAEGILSRSGGQWKQMFELIQQANANDADNARCLLVRQLREWRGIVWTHARRNSHPMCSTNLLTAFGSSKRELAASMRASTGRITSAQLVAALVGFCLFLEHQLEATGECELNAITFLAQ